ncbi:putative DNA repair dioxygenase [Bodo saltans virus]|uniref:DNA repair dioxygenase n=1 Tax=Bodo saltans virus TaxID=2024608 RepID=A0A2H4UTW3_9VIRU|nr:putative DNA repair dioxygenase [Bodo saltans virus]ATZ80383.1 putative DNA repair dioxygenase [Bodo saltans virus]
MDTQILSNIRDMLRSLIINYTSPILQPIQNIDGLFYCDNFIDDKMEQKIIHLVNQEKWSSELSRRVQHYGYKYDYKRRTTDPHKDYIGELPVWTDYIIHKMFCSFHKTCIHLPFETFDQLIVNEYKKGQGIGKHTDCISCFSNGIAIISLNNDSIITFEKNGIRHDIHVKRKSLVLMTDDARYNWTHAIIPMNNNNFTNDKPRISITFRFVKK